MKWKVKSIAAPDGCISYAMNFVLQGGCAILRRYRRTPSRVLFICFSKELGSPGYLLWRDTRNKKVCHKLMCWESQLGSIAFQRVSKIPCAFALLTPLLFLNLYLVNPDSLLVFPSFLRERTSQLSCQESELIVFKISRLLCCPLFRGLR